MSRPLPRLLSLAALSAVLVLSGCGIPGLPGATGAPNRESAAVEHAAAVDKSIAQPPMQADPATPESASDDGWQAVPGDLSDGAHTSRLGAAAHTLVIDYWTSENPAEWTPDSTPIINITARIDEAGDGESVRVTRFEARVDGTGTVLASDAGSFAVEQPFAYTTGMVLPSNPAGRSSRIIVTFDLLTETARGSGVFTRQTVLDALTVGYAKPGSVSPAAQQDNEG